MRISKHAAMGATSLFIGALGATVAPSTAKAGCCPSNWSAPSYDIGDSNQCDVIVGGGRVDGVSKVENLAGAERYVNKVEAAPGAYSPTVRAQVKCIGFANVVTTEWVKDPISPFYGVQGSCGGGLEWTKCQTRLADDTYCTGACD
jgi:hypothetical protein